MTSQKKKDPSKFPARKGRGPLTVVYRKADDIKPYPKNPYTHPPEQIDAIARSIENVGWTKPIIVDENIEILAGHGAYQAGLQLGHKEMPTIMRAGLTSAQRRAYRIWDNKGATKSTEDHTLLAGEFADLKRMGFDLSLTGFEPTEIEFMLAPPPSSPSEPPVPKVEKRTISKLGDLWLLGEHRLICADSTKPATYKTLMDGRQAQCVFTDPPYGISYAAPSGAFEVIANDDLRRGQLKDLLKGAMGAALKHVREDAGWYIWHASGTREEFTSAMRDLGIVELCLIFWEKPGATLGWGDYRQAHEPCFYAARQGVKPAFYGDRTGVTVWRLEGPGTPGEPTSIGTGLIITGPDGNEIYLAAKAPKGKKVRHLHLTPGTPLLLVPKTSTDDVWQVSRDAGHGKDSALHPTMKPVELARRACVNSAREGEIVLDFFGGAGSTLMAAEQTKRVGYVSEIDPHYVDVIVRRWQTMTGKQAIHAETNKPFEALERSRKAR